MRDFVLAHYVTASGPDAPFWHAIRDSAPPETLVARLEAFAATGTILYDRGDLFGPTNWLAVLTGQGCWPRDHHPIAAAMPAALVAERIGRLEDRAAAMAAAMPPHRTFVARHVGTAPSADQNSLSSATRS